MNLLALGWDCERCGGSYATTVDADHPAEHARARRAVEAGALGHMNQCRSVVVMRNHPVGDVPAGEDEKAVSASAT